MEDTTGWFYDINKEYEGLILERSTTESTSREPWYKAEYVEPDLTYGLRGTNYMTIRLQASNQRYVITRKYKKLIDVLSDVGGLAEVITFIIAVLYSWHNEIRLNQLLINEGILGHKKH